jgi:hypothetical protein
MEASRMRTLATPPRPASYDKSVALILQGGGALGSYQAGVYKALSTSDYPPDWVAGISIGAVNAAIIAGNAPGRRVARLRQFWEGITAPSAWWPAWLNGALGAGWGDHRHAAAAALLFGQPGFFAPRPPSEWLFSAALTSLYDTAALKRTLEALVDFDRINARELRLSAGAVSVTTMDMVGLIDRLREVQGHARDCEFSRRTMDARWARGRADAETTLRASPWLAPMPPKLGARTFDVLTEARKAAAAGSACSRTTRATSMTG